MRGCGRCPAPPARPRTGPDARGTCARQRGRLLHGAHALFAERHGALSPLLQERPQSSDDALPSNRQTSCHMMQLQHIVASRCPTHPPTHCARHAGTGAPAQRPAAAATHTPAAARCSRAAAASRPSLHGTHPRSCVGSKQVSAPLQHCVLQALSTWTWRDSQSRTGVPQSAACLTATQSKPLEEGSSCHRIAKRVPSWQQAATVPHSCAVPAPESLQALLEGAACYRDLPSSPPLAVQAGHTGFHVMHRLSTTTQCNPELVG